jgi:sugar phosphate isomerase/epimerase
MKLSISTLACPAWTFQQIVDGAAAAGVAGIDFRGIASEIDITKLPQFNADLPETLRVLGEKNLRMPCLNLSTTLVTPDAKRWSDFIEETTRAARLSQQTQTKFLRVFGGMVPKEMTRAQGRSLAHEHLKQVCDIAAAHGAMILLESHDDWSTSEQVLELLGDLPPDRVGVLWDFEHSVRRGETCAATADALSDYLRHVHVKDSLAVDGRNTPTLLGVGDMPIDEAIAALKAINYAGWYTLETEKRWRSDAPEPEVSIPQFVDYMRKRLH